MLAGVGLLAQAGFAVSSVAKISLAAGTAILLGAIFWAIAAASLVDIPMGPDLEALRTLAA